MKIAHISDLHVKCEWYEDRLGNNLVKYLNAQKPDLLIITGDLTDYGYYAEYKRAYSFLELIEVEKRVVVPGNHDARNEGYELFEEFFGTRMPYYEDEYMVIIGMDSSLPDREEGHIGRKGYKFLRETLKDKGDKLKIVALHHHVVPIPATGSDLAILTDAGNLMKVVDELGVELVLTGHKHKAWVWKLNETYYVTAGTATTRRLKAKDYPSFYMLYLEDEKNIRMEKVNTETLKVEEVYTLNFEEGKER
ncbi:metallophosphoesterase family protein [Aquifex aeolicus]|uniref:Calcineurin-like phosphoesterase domain-containing protein n=1 Tax=Aquifex aeolicus (strain VF5) TaxID=224324 RepID=O66909_AQUAE|nr:metallophosphoesterase [Aquifex aeolicus]AAC06876.1 putative protein [Aquifex aeolicus VF5]